MAPATAIEKLLKSVRKDQKSRGRGQWAEPFPHDKVAQPKIRVTKVIKHRPQPIKDFMSIQSLYDRQEERLVISTPKAEVSLATPKAKVVLPPPRVIDRPTSKVQVLLPNVRTKVTAQASKVSKVSKVSKAPMTIANRATTHDVNSAPAHKRESRCDSYSPTLATTSKVRPPHSRTISNTSSASAGSLKSSSCSVTSVKGVHLLLAIIPEDQHAAWLEDWDTLCVLSGDNFPAYYSSIETGFDSAGIQLYADCENKLMADMLRNKLFGEEVLGHELICKII
ncbi:hypothetical protein E4T42_08367 [Aureobasidium subglaciale]|nr:hypothetical protein E4T42_08367 [Aureobasidium subglaciale]